MMTRLACPRCSTQIEAPATGKPVCPTCQYPGRDARRTAPPPVPHQQFEGETVDTGFDTAPQHEDPAASSTTQQRNWQGTGFSQPPPGPPPAPLLTGTPSVGMGVLALILNIAVFPGLGSIIGGKTQDGIVQIILTVVGIVLTFIFIGIIPLMAAWIWALITGITLIQEGQRYEAWQRGQWHQRAQ